jgi:hypothetical protein
MQVVCKSELKEYEAEVGRDSRISIIMESAKPTSGGPPSFQQLQVPGGAPRPSWHAGTRRTKLSFTCSCPATSALQMGRVIGPLGPCRTSSRAMLPALRP